MRRSRFDAAAASSRIAASAACHDKRIATLKLCFELGPRCGFAIRRPSGGHLRLTRRLFNSALLLGVLGRSDSGTTCGGCGLVDANAGLSVAVLIFRAVASTRARLLQAFKPFAGGDRLRAVDLEDEGGDIDRNRFASLKSW
jgi:hypothetical protein